MINGVVLKRAGIRTVGEIRKTSDANPGIRALGGPVSLSFGRRWAPIRLVEPGLKAKK